MVDFSSKERISERRYVHKWLAKKHRESLQWTNSRLGPAFDNREGRMMAVTSRYADAIFIEGGVVNIVEAKDKPKPEITAQLEIYKDLFRITPRFKSYWNWPVKLWIVTPNLDMVVMKYAQDRGINYEVWQSE